MINKRILVTGAAGFIGFHLCRELLAKGFYVHGFDGITDYYDVNLKRRRLSFLLQHPYFSMDEAMLEDFDRLRVSCNRFNPDVIIHLAAQAGVRYSMENPRSYIDSNITGTFNVLEVARENSVDHLLMASTSSVYGTNLDMPFKETDKADTPLTIYAATKKANEVMAHSYASLWGIPTTMLRFFTVYGPWGRPDLALFKFVECILNNKPIDIYNMGNMYRDFTYVDDLVKSIRLLIDVPPLTDLNSSVGNNNRATDTIPYRVVNIGNSTKVKLTKFINFIEEELNKKARRNYLPMQLGDVKETWSDCTLLKELTGYQPNTKVRTGINKFIEWYKEYYNV